MNVLDLFSGIGGFSLGLERAGMKTVAFCEIEDYPRRVLAKHWPGVPIYEDVRDVSKQRLDADGIGRIDVITGGFPCQDISVAGKQAGIKGERSGLWGECARILGDFQPRYAIFENVTALISGDSGGWFKRVLWDISQVGYDAEWHCIPASELGAHHHRDRVWIICYPQELQRNGGELHRKHSKGEVYKPGDSGGKNDIADTMCRRKRDSETFNQSSLDEKRNAEAPRERRAPITSETGGDDALADTMQQGLQRRSQYGIFGEGGQRWHELTAGQFRRFGDISQVEPTIRRDYNGISDYAHRLKGLGNAVVPQIPEIIGRAIIELEQNDQQE